MEVPVIVFVFSEEPVSLEGCCGQSALLLMNWFLLYMDSQ